MLKPPANQSQEPHASRSALASERGNPTHAEHAWSRDPANNFDSIRGGDSYQRISALQKSAGNQAVLRMLSHSAPVLRTKLTVNHPGDHYEQEADRVADHVMRMPDTGEALPAAVSVPKLQRKCACGGSGGGSCSECAEKKELQRSANQPHSVPQAPPLVHQVLSQPGQTLDATTRNFFEPRFNLDFSRVRIHTNAQAAASAQAVNARAYTVAPDIAFAAGQYQPGTDSGRMLLAHELAHVAQSQSQSEVSTVRRFASREHKELGDEASGGALSDINIGSDAAPQYLSYGEVVALAGDYFGSLAEMRDLAKTTRGKARIRWTRWWALDKSPATEPPLSDVDKQAVRDRYYTLAGGNISHFSAGGTADATYQAQHTEALRLAFATGVTGARQGRSLDPTAARTQEAFAQHFLSDMFSGGHVRTEREAIKQWYQEHMPDAMTRIVAYMAHHLHEFITRRHNFVADWLFVPSEADIAVQIRQLGGAALQSFSLGDIVSLGWHNADSQGIAVVSDANASGAMVPGGYKWQAAGDSMLKTSPTTRGMAVAAMRVSLGEIDTMATMGDRAAAGISPDDPLGTAKAFAPAVARLKPFAAERFIPDADPAAKNPNMVYQWGWMSPAMYDAVDEAVKGDVADMILEIASHQTGDQHDALVDFAELLQIIGAHALEIALDQPARIPHPHYGLFGEPATGAP